MLIKPLKYRIALIHKLLFHPFVHPDFPDSLQKRNFSLQQLPPVKPGPRLYIDGYIAQKDGCGIETNNEKKLLAVESIDEKFLDIMKELIKISEEDSYLNLKSDLDYIEFSGNFVIIANNNPLDTVQKFKPPIFNKISKIFDQEIAQFELRIVPNDLKPNSRNWFDIQIQPRLTKSDKEFYVSVIYRSENLENVLRFSNKINDKLVSIITCIEEA